LKTFSDHPGNRARTLVRLLLIVLLGLGNLPATGMAQNLAARPGLDAVDDDRGAPPPYLDRKVGTALERFAAWQNRMKTENFTQYFVGLSVVGGVVFGLIVAVTAFRLGDPMARYTKVRNRTSLLAAACGAGLGVLIAVTQVSPAARGKVSLLVLAVVVCALTMGLVTLGGFIIQRTASLYRARRSGVVITGRLRLP